MTYFKPDHTIVIAEAGINHDGNLDAALEMVRVAADAGADFVKFQAYRAHKLCLPVAERSSYIVEGSHEKESFQDLLKRIELDFDGHRAAKKLSDELGIKFLSTAFDFEALDFLCDELKCEVIKIASADLTNIPFLKHVGSKRLPVILSTGMGDIDEIDLAVETLKAFGADEICILHCVSWYPCPFEIVNLRAMLTLGQRYGQPVGYSDHTLGLALPSAAVAMGARVIEKHYTLDPTAFGPDHKASVDPATLKAMVSNIREVEAALGNGDKSPQGITDIEMNQRRVHRRSVVTSRPIKAGEVLSVENLDIRRPGTGIAPKHLDAIIGHVAARDIEGEVLLNESDVTGLKI